MINSSVYVRVWVPPQLLGFTVAVPVLAGNVLEVQLIDTLGGHVNSGAVLSSRTIVCTHVPVFPHASVAVHVRRMVGSARQGPGTVASL